ncbi:Ribosomal RNA small subunit methyltransferase I [bioreactor metagenome]|uniref:Ribosomal RNA small subunit methyltransferase I n=1 Tax=bioreactor metagenome TaxID=1076179 RepID=A0A644TTK6_9ZZZZ|nr:16S rRNA (cytidine(1402)-2'-O)-methyltransferase [Negativicutes bacterium]
MSETTGTLYLCATPIGNLEDITFRVLNVLKQVDVIGAEDTRHTLKLLNHFEIHTPMISYHEHNKADRGPELVERLRSGQDVAIVSDAGMPGISDPGSDLVQLALEAGIKVTPLPGANAALAGLVCSGLDTRMFTFIGFLPKTTKKRRELISTLATNPYTLIFYESPHRLKATLAELAAGLGDRQAAAGRELTKKFEEFVRGSLTKLQEHFAMHQPRGEFTLIIAGTGEEKAPVPSDEEDQSSPLEAVLNLVAQGTNKKDAIRMVALKRGISKREVYQAVVEHEKTI